MTKFQEKEVEKWNVRDFHDYLTARTEEKFGVDYIPFGKGPISQRWRTEQGQLKNAMKEFGNEVLKACIDFCIDNYRPGRYPFINFGFMYAYKRDDFARVQFAYNRQLKLREELERQKAEQDETGTEWY